MLTSQDYAGFVKQLGDIEKKMIGVYTECGTLTSDVAAKRVCAMLSAQEVKHFELVKELAKLFDVPDIIE
jgi:hypothetical protein